MLRSFRPLILCALLLAAFFRTIPARAWPYYFEFGGSMATYSTPGPLLLSQGKQTSTSASGGADIPLTLAIQLQERQSGILFSLGLQQRYLTGTSALGDSFTAMPTSPIFRIEFWRLVFGVGYSTWVWENLSFKKDSSINSVLTLETQFLFPITPEIDFGLQASRESFKSDRYGAGPTVTEYGAFFRLNFGMSDSASSERRKFKGWRYPFGSPIR